jgi:hypothetical protein
LRVAVCVQVGVHGVHTSVRGFKDSELAALAPPRRCSAPKPAGHVAAVADGRPGQC